MSSLHEIEQAIDKLPREDFFRLRERLQKRFDDQWDRQFAEDATTGRLDPIAEQALAEHRTGRSKPFPPDAQQGS